METLAPLGNSIRGYHGSSSPWSRCVGPPQPGGLRLRTGKLVTNNGVVSNVIWRNPHVFVIWDVKDGSGSVVKWTGELSSPTTMISEGMARDTFKAGDPITATFMPAKAARHTASSSRSCGPTAKSCSICQSGATCSNSKRRQGETIMRYRMRVFIMTLAAVAAFSGAASAQEPGRTPEKPVVASVPAPEGWKTCPRCQNETDRREANAKCKVEGHAFNPRDLSGVWCEDGCRPVVRESPTVRLSEKNGSRRQSARRTRRASICTRRTRRASGAVRR